jgi:antitoxin component of MazEF toxin-antitoxin module
LVLVIDPQLLEQLRIDETADLELTVHDSKLMIATASSQSETAEDDAEYQRRVRAGMDYVHERYVETFRRLAE